MNDNINLCEILENCPKGTKFFSYIHGQVKFSHIDLSISHPIIVTAETKRYTLLDKTFSKEGYYDNDYNGICILVPSLEQPDWSKWECPKPKKPKFDPKTLKAFDKVLVRSEKVFNWNCSLFSNIDDSDSKYLFTCLGLCYRFCIPYNDDTKHLIGTTDEAPEFYRYWED